MVGFLWAINCHRIYYYTGPKQNFGQTRYKSRLCLFNMHGSNYAQSLWKSLAQTKWMLITWNHKRVLQSNSACLQPMPIGWACFLVSVKIENFKQIIFFSWRNPMKHSMTSHNVLFYSYSSGENFKPSFDVRWCASSLKNLLLLIVFLISLSVILLAFCSSLHTPVTFYVGVCLLLFLVVIFTWLPGLLLWHGCFDKSFWEIFEISV